ncbi:MAG: hypothetical protein P8017_08155, partial [Deltaproteobacteria bacterium]
MRCEIRETREKIPHLTSRISHPSVLRLFRELVAAAICAALFCNPHTALGLVGDTESTFGLDGRLSTTNLLIDNYNFEPFFDNNSTDQTSQNVLRLIAAGRPTDQLHYEVQGLQSYTYFSSRRETGALYF